MAEEPREDATAIPLTKIIATIGPASSSPQTVGRLIEAGVSVFRLNFSHGTLEDHAQAMLAIREAAACCEKPVAVLGDLQGPKIRVGNVADDGVEVQAGATVVFQREPLVAQGAEPQRFSSTYERLVDDVEVGQRLLINDGAVRMLVTEKRPDELTCTVAQGGLVTSGKGINLPDTDLTVDAMTERDRRNVAWAIEHDLDFLALSFVRGAGDVNELAALIESATPVGNRVPIIAKIEVPGAVEQIEAIVEAADGIMVARGDLGVEMDLARVPVIQKRLLAVAQDHGKPCIVATQMLESMIEKAAPTRAEVSDVAGAIFDQADAVMLSGETAVGRHAVLAVQHMARIAMQTEGYLATLPPSPSPPAKLQQSRYHAAALAHGVWTIAQDVVAACIVVWSESGAGARYLSQNNFTVPIFAVTSDERAARRMQLLRGVVPLRMDPPKSIDAFGGIMDHYLRNAGKAQPGDAFILIGGEPLGESGVTDSIAIHTVGE